MKPAARPAASKIALVGENAAAFGQSGDHQAVPGNEDLGVHGRRHAFLACGQEERPAGRELGFELALVAGEELGRLVDRPGQVEDVVIFPVALLGDVVNIAKCFGSFGTQQLGDFGEGPHVVLAFHALAVGILGRMECAVGAGHPAQDVVHRFRGRLARNPGSPVN